MLVSFGLALLGHSSLASAQQSGSGLRVFPGTGPLSNFPGVSWRYNGDLRPWGSHANLDFVPMVKDELAVMNVQAAMQDTWMATQEINQVFSLEHPYEGASAISASKGAELQKKISDDIKGLGMNIFTLGTPSIKAKHGSVDEAGLSWLQSMIQECQGACLLDFMVIDYEGDSAAEMAATMDMLHSTLQLPIWVKTLACVTKEGGYCTSEIATLFMNDSIGWYKSNKDVVERWAWDGADPSIASLGDPTGMLNADGTLNAMGKKYDELR